MKKKPAPRDQIRAVWEELDRVLAADPSFRFSLEGPVAGEEAPWHAVLMSGNALVSSQWKASRTEAVSALVASLGVQSGAKRAAR